MKEHRFYATAKASGEPGSWEFEFLQANQHFEAAKIGESSFLEIWGELR
jgi:hypothetical protein